ncbi:Hydrogen peroxide-inducible genes activator [Candidatus Rhodobacter oscarellae]|uniref:Hydrogen peroxide-inducible genes activator n=1 Tax=Candidatus Rhodobacter oscarellae TaxID=1675527 RepID=A0A0J9E298_9RHOB|nr:hydrogen peroxide-inducible genes activator [Candidatus Rhodobacter lobularis]KMW56855.1 Hydrogen peroxide-inducible genes activator [Candidatus Rhodobacter lobularis]
MALTLKQLTYFVALAEARSFGVAAAKVHISQPALSLQIKELELNLGTLLVERLPRDIRLTRAGQTLLERARAVLSDLRDLEHAVRLQQGLTGRLSLGVIPTVAPYLLPQALSRIRARDLTLDIRIREAQTAVLVEALAAGQLDAAVMSLPLERGGLVAEPLFEDRFVLAGSETRLSRFAGGAPRPKEVPQDHLLLLDEGHCLADQALEVCGLNARPGPMDMGASSLATLTGLVAQGFGLTLLPEIALTAETAAAPQLCLRRFAGPEPARTLALVRRETSEAAWVSDLAALLREAGEDLISHARGAGRL